MVEEQKSSLAKFEFLIFKRGEKNKTYPMQHKHSQKHSQELSCLVHTLSVPHLQDIMPFARKSFDILSQSRGVGDES